MFSKIFLSIKYISVIFRNQNFKDLQFSVIMKFMKSYNVFFLLTEIIV